MTETEEMGQRIRASLPNVKRGSLRFFGQWFGRPHDNIHSVVGCDTDQDCLILFFNGGEQLRIWSPSNLKVNDTTFRIRTAARVRWEWNYYGRPPSQSNKCFIEFESTKDGIVGRELFEGTIRIVKGSRSENAIEIL